MNEKEWLTLTEEWVKTKLSKDTTGHDMWHILRVVRLTEKIVEKENANMFVCQMAAYLHDIPDEKLVDDVRVANAEINDFLHQIGLNEQIIIQIWDTMKDISFRGNHKVPDTIEGKIVQDADRLDAIGAIGVARTFAYGGSKGHKMHDPELEMDTKNNPIVTITKLRFIIFMKNF